ncbi:DUF3341 domain-containing protein [Proteobacteria bacterium 005FR1]|nr:DUF3341 domain-containing protein [Proteobacteria bacterium 005FR1]
MSEQRLHGYLLEFADVEDLLEAARHVVGIGYRDVEAFTPFPVHELEDVLPPCSNPIAFWVLVGGLLGGLLGYGIQYYSAVIDYPYLVGGKPMHAWPAFIPVTFELTVLFGAFGAFLASIFANGLPQLHHPIFAAEDFDLASRDRFFLLIEACDKLFDAQRTRTQLENVKASQLHSVDLEES